MATVYLATFKAIIPACRRSTKDSAIQREVYSLRHTSILACRHLISIPRTSGIRVADDTYSLFQAEYHVAHRRWFSLPFHCIPDLWDSWICDGPDTRFQEPGSSMPSVSFHVGGPVLSYDVQMERCRIYRNVVYNAVLFFACFDCGYIAAFINGPPCSLVD
jgi:hypothetical protein